MSSHHVVKDKQEPALIVANGAACSAELLGQLLEWSPTVMVLDGALSRVDALGIKIDVVLGDLDSVAEDFEQIIAHQQPIEVINTPDQNSTDLEKGIEWFIDKGYPAVNIVWALGRRADHAFSNISIMNQYKNRIKLVMIDDHTVAFPLLSNFQKWYTAGTKLSLIPLGAVKGIKTENLLYHPEGDELILGLKNGNSNQVVADGMVSISYKEGELILMECVD